jgi:hypothetical protein
VQFYLDKIWSKQKAWNALSRRANNKREFDAHDALNLEGGERECMHTILLEMSAIPDLDRKFYSLIMQSLGKYFVYVCVYNNDECTLKNIFSLLSLSHACSLFSQKSPLKWKN